MDRPDPTKVRELLELERWRNEKTSLSFVFADGPAVDRKNMDRLMILREKLVRPLAEDWKRLNKWVDDLQAGMSINCVYCGHNYGPDDGDHLNTMREALHAHVAKCPKHPLSRCRKLARELAAAARKAEEREVWDAELDKAVRAVEQADGQASKV